MIIFLKVQCVPYSANCPTSSGVTRDLSQGGKA